LNFITSSSDIFGGYFVEVKSHFSFDDEDMMIASTFFLKYTPN
jgi:hypothetical protein